LAFFIILPYSIPVFDMVSCDSDGPRRAPEPWAAIAFEWSSAYSVCV
jgi:hypothetical protein